jgi:hypothetical protein
MEGAEWWSDEGLRILLAGAKRTVAEGMKRVQEIQAELDRRAQTEKPP